MILKGEMAKNQRQKSPREIFCLFRTTPYNIPSSQGRNLIMPNVFRDNLWTSFIFKLIILQFVDYTN
jgi:hypothetical protein